MWVNGVSKLPSGVGDPDAGCYYFRRAGAPACAAMESAMAKFMADFFGIDVIWG